MSAVVVSVVVSVAACLLVFGDTRSVNASLKCLCEYHCYALCVAPIAVIIDDQK